MAKIKLSQTKINLGNHGSCLCTFYNNGAANVMIIDSLFVKEEARGKGLATKIIKKAIVLAKKRNIDSIELVVNNDNLIAKHLYKKTGFEKTKKEYHRLILNKK